MDNTNIREFPVVVYGNLNKFSETMSQARVRIFYKGLNRNGTYITDEFAQKLIDSLPYAPVKGIYDTDDFTDHGKARTEGRAYGVVANPPNFAWERHLDEDGVEREYACADVLLWTGLYQEAKEIPGKAQSMELYEPTLKGQWKVIENRRCFEFSDGCFLGLQALGTDVEPCFEGGQFYSLYTYLRDMVDQITKFQLNLNSQLDLNKGGKLKMINIDFKLSDNQKQNAIFSLLNPNFNEQDGYVLAYSICNVYDEYAVCFNYELGQFERVYYAKNDKEDSLALGKKEKCYILDVSESEKAALNSLQEGNGTFEKVLEVVGEVNSLKEDKITNDTKITELNTTLSTLTTEKETSDAALVTANETIHSLNSELEGLKEYKVKAETQEKETILASYTELLSEATINSFKEKIADYTAVSLEKELAFTLVKSNPTVFTKQPLYLPKDEPKGGIEEILSKYKK